MPPPLRSRPTARGQAARAVGRAAERFPDLPIVAPEFTGLDPRDTRLAVAIYRAVIQRWLTLAHLLNRQMRQPLERLEPPLQGVLLTAAAQLVAMDRLPVHAVVDESVELARRTVRAGAAPMANAILRRLAATVERPVHGQPWRPAPDRYPLDDGYGMLTEPALPDPQRLEEHLSAATSHPRPLIRHWLEQFGPEETARVAAAGVRTPPIVLAVEPGFAAAPPAGPGKEWRPHAQEGFIIWEGSREAMVRFMQAHPARRVQDPAASLPVRATAGMEVRVAVDYCAGRGTKTRQLAVTHPAARIVATDVDTDRLGALTESVAPHPNIEVVEPGRIQEALRGHRADVLLLDVPCSNTGVLARRPEARYRFSRKSLADVARLQQQILEQATPLLVSGGTLLYSTCSIEREENQEQAAWIVERFAAQVQSETLTLPEGHDATYRDGGYFALFRWR